MALLKDLYRYQVQIIKPLYGENLVRNPRAVRSTTGYFSRGGASVSIDDTHTRRGPSCLRIGGQTGESGVLYLHSPGFTLENGKPYSFSVDVLGPADMPMALELGNVAGTTTDVRKEFVATGNWQRVEINHQQPTGSMEPNRRISVLKKAGTTPEVFWVDGFQFEVSEKATTFILGYNTGLGYMGNRSEYGWKGLPYESVSWRSGWTRHGGALVDLAEYANIKNIAGLGMSPFEQVTTPIVTGGQLYQTYIRESRPFSIQLQYTGDNVVEIQKKRQAVLDLVRPDNTPYHQPLVMRVQMVDARNNEAGDPVDVICVFLTSHTNTPVNVTSQTDTLSFSCLDGHLLGAFRDGATLDYRVEFDANYIVRRDADGKWVNDSGNNPLAGVAGGAIYDIKEAPNGDIYVCGSFSKVSNGSMDVANTKGIARWSKANQVWEAVGNPETGATIDDIQCMEFDAAGNLFIGGNFQRLSNKVGINYIAKYTLSTSQWSAVGPVSSLNSPVRTMAVSPAGVLYIGGSNRIISGVDTSFAMQDPVNKNWVALDMPGIIAGGNIDVLKFAPDGRLVIAGDIHDVGSTNGDYICYMTSAGVYVPFTDYGAQNLPSNVRAMDFMPDGTLVIGMSRSTVIEGDPLGMVAYWNGTDWQTLGGVKILPIGGAGAAIMMISCHPDGSVYISGVRFGLEGREALPNLALVYKGGTWQTLDVKTDNPFDTFYAILYGSDNTIYIGGDFNGGLITAPNVSEIEYKSMTSSGSANTYPEFTIVGPGRLDSIINHATARRIQFNDLILQEGEEIWINLDPTNLKMTSNWAGRGNVWRYVNAGSDIGDWYMQPGKNIIGVFIPDGFDVDKTKVYVQWQPKFWSLDGAAY